MSTLTTRLGLVKPAGPEYFSVGTDNDNNDKIDAAVGFEECTSSTRPSSPYNGKGIYETDTGAVLFSNGSAPASGSWKYLWTASGPIVVGVTGATLAPLRVRTTSTIAGNRLIDARKDGEAEPGWSVDFDGKQQWGPGGSTGPDTNLYRSTADTLKTDDSFIVGSALTVSGNTTLSSALTVTGNTTFNGTIAATAAAMTSVQSATNGTAGTTTSTSATDNLTSSTTVTQGFTVPPSGKVKVTISGELQNSGANYTTLSFRISGSAGTVAHDDNNALYVRGTDPFRGSATTLVTGLSPGQTGTVTLSHLVTGGTGTFNRRRILVEPAW